jgi:hypothetical protein
MRYWRLYSLAFIPLPCPRSLGGHPCRGRCEPLVVDGVSPTILSRCLSMPDLGQQGVSQSTMIPHALSMVRTDLSPQEPRTDLRAWRSRWRPTSPRSCVLKSAFRVRFMADAQLRKHQGAARERRQASPSPRQILMRPHFLVL